MGKGRRAEPPDGSAGVPPPEKLGPLGLPRAPLWPRGQWARLLGLFVLAVGATVVSFAIVSRIAHPRLPGGAPAPPITLQAAGTGQRHDVLAEQQGRPFVLEFFETTCAICQREVKPMCDIHSRHTAIAFYGIDAARESSDAVSRWGQTQANGCTAWPLLLDPQSAVLRSYMVTVVPTIYLIDARGRVAYTGTGEAGVSGLDDALRRVSDSG